MPNFTASIPHRLGRAEAKRRIIDQIGELRQQSGSLLANLKETWTGDRMDFMVCAVGQTVSGHLIVDDQLVYLDIALPWLLNLLAGAVMQRIEKDVQRLLSDSAHDRGGTTRNA